MPIAAALAGAMPGARLRVLDDAGHLIFIERFADVNREVITFLEPRGPVGQQREAGDPPAGVRRWTSGLSQALRRRLENMKDGILNSNSPGVMPPAEVLTCPQLAAAFRSTGGVGRIVKLNTTRPAARTVGPISEEE